MNKIEELYAHHPAPVRFAAGYFEYLARLLTSLDCNQVGAFIEAILKVREQSRTVFFIGNGGSAATASHFANDLAVGTRSKIKPFRAVSLTDNNAVLTAIANDDGYDLIFVQQLQYLMQSGDMVVGISASGNSPNVVKAFEYANRHGATTVGLTGFDGGRLKDLSTIKLHVPTAKGEYGPVEDVHMVFDHLVGSFIKMLCQHEK